MLNGPGWVFSPEPALEWLHRIVKATSTVQKLWGKNSNGERTTELLMRMWDNVRNKLHSNTASQQRYAALVDQLVAVGVPLASILQQKLENL